jgi:hypothetical protein
MLHGSVFCLSIDADMLQFSHAGVGTGEGSYEYLVFNNTLIGVAAKHGLRPLTDWGDPDLNECFDEVLAPSPLHMTMASFSLHQL